MRVSRRVLTILPGDSYEEVARWLQNFVTSHAKRESPRVEGVVETPGEREGRSYGVRLRLGDRFLPPPAEPPVELAYPEVADGRAKFVWCETFATRVRRWARELLDAEAGRSFRSA